MTVTQKILRNPTAAPRKRKNDKKSVRCPVETTIEAFGGRRKVLIIYYLLESAKRCGELPRLLSGVSARTLTRQLRELANSNVIERYVHQQIPPGAILSLTPWVAKSGR